MQALILAGGEGTRLRPLTTTVPKPVVPLVDRPFIVFMLDWLRGHGVDDVVMSCGHMAAGVRNVLGDGTRFGIRLRYVEEPRPLGTGGALKFAEPLLDERFLMLNGDVLTDIDLTAQIAQHERTGARGDAGADAGRGPVRLRPRAAPRDDGEVTEFVEKPSPDQIDTRNISAGAYVLERSVLDLLEPEPARLDRARRLPAARRRRALRLRGRRLLAGHRDARRATSRAPSTSSRARSARASPSAWATATCAWSSGVENAGRIIPSALVETGCRIGEGARIGGRVVLESGVSVGANTTIERAVVHAGRRDRRELHAARLHRRPAACGSATTA